jgi:hypothetical protein
VPELNRLYLGVASRGKHKGRKLTFAEPGAKVDVRIYKPQR